MSTTKVTSPGIDDGSVTAEKLADGSVTTAKIANNAVTTAKITFENSLVPTGTVFHFASASAPAGYLVCDGSTIPNGPGTVQNIQANFSALYAIIGSTYGSAGKLPDLRGEFIRGWDAGKGIDIGRVFGSSQDSTRINSIYASAIVGDNFENGEDGVTTRFSQEGPFTSSYRLEQIRPRNIALLPCIKY